MLAKLALRYHSLTFVVAKINVYCCTCAVVCHVVSKVENGVLLCTAGCKKENSRPFCCEVVMTHVLVHLQKIRAKELRKCGKYKHYDAEVQAKMAKHACVYGNKSAFVKFTQELGH